MQGDDRALERKRDGLGFIDPELTPSDLLPQNVGTLGRKQVGRRDRMSQHGHGCPAHR
jgi:hypothetical protein